MPSTTCSFAPLTNLWVGKTRRLPGLVRQPAGAPPPPVQQLLQQCLVLLCVLRGLATSQTYHLPVGCLAKGGGQPGHAAKRQHCSGEGRLIAHHLKARRSPGHAAAIGWGTNARNDFCISSCSLKAGLQLGVGRCKAWALREKLTWVGWSSCCACLGAWALIQDKHLMSVTFVASAVST